MTKRKHLSAETDEQVLTRSGRRCCLCFHLKKDFGEKLGQIAHLDGDSSNADPDNLAFLCLDHHTVYDSRTSQHKNYTTTEVKKARARLHAEVEQYKPRDWTLVLHGNFADFDRAGVEAIAEHLRGLLGDAHLTIRRVESGSIKLHITSSESAFEKMNALMLKAAGRSVAGHHVEEVKGDDSYLLVDPTGSTFDVNLVDSKTRTMFIGDGTLFVRTRSALESLLVLAIRGLGFTTVDTTEGIEVYQGEPLMKERQRSSGENPRPLLFIWGDGVKTPEDALAAIERLGTLNRVVEKGALPLIRKVEQFPGPKAPKRTGRKTDTAG